MLINLLFLNTDVLNDEIHSLDAIAVMVFFSKKSGGFMLPPASQRCKNRNSLMILPQQLLYL